jgi:transposase-like protein
MNSRSSTDTPLVWILTKIHLQGVSTHKIKAITEELCGHDFSALVISTINRCLDEGLQYFMAQPPEEEFSYLILEMRYEKVREEGTIRSRAVLVALRMKLGRTPSGLVR